MTTAEALALAAEFDERADGHLDVARSDRYSAEVARYNAAVGSAFRVAAEEIRRRLVDGEPVVDLGGVTGEADAE